MKEKKGSFEEMSAQSVPYERLSDIKRQIIEIERNYRRLCIYTINLICKSYLKDQEIDTLYCRMYELAEMPKKKKERKKIRRNLQMIENRSQNRQNEFLPLTDFFDIGMLSVRNISRPRAKGRGRIDSFGRGGSSYNDFCADIWDDERDMDHDRYE